MLSPEYESNIEIAYKILINYDPAKSCGTSGIPVLFFSCIVKDENEILWFYSDATLGQSGMSCTSAVQM